MYTVQFTQAANRELQRLPSGVIRRVIAAIDRLIPDPRPHGVRKLVGGQNAYRIRVGVYRVIYEVDDQEHKVLITRVRHRSEAYE